MTFEGFSCKEDVRKEIKRILKDDREETKAKRRASLFVFSLFFLPLILLVCVGVVSANSGNPLTGAIIGALAYAVWIGILLFIEPY